MKSDVHMRGKLTYRVMAARPVWYRRVLLFIRRMWV